MAEVGCTIRLNGEIKNGDLETLLSLLQTPLQQEQESIFNYAPSLTVGFPNNDHRSCLNSPGGSYKEAMDTIGALGRAAWENPNPRERGNGNRLGSAGVPTAVAKGDRCVSVCALVFMSGRWAFDVGRREYWNPNRILHPEGKLGFHAPFIQFGEGSYSKRQVENSWDISMLSVSALLEQIKSRNVAINYDLLSAILTTRYPNLRYIETVEDLVRFQIDVAPIRTAIPPIDADTICIYASTLIEEVEEVVYLGSSSPVQQYTGKNSWGSDQIQAVLESSFEFARSGLRERYDCIIGGVNEIGRMVEKAPEYRFHLQDSLLQHSWSVGFRRVASQGTPPYSMDDGSMDYGPFDGSVFFLFDPKTRIEDL